MQALSMMLSLLHLQLLRLPRTLDHVLCTLLCLLSLASTGVLLTLQAAAFLTSLALLRQVCDCMAVLCINACVFMMLCLPNLVDALLLMRAGGRSHPVGTHLAVSRWLADSCITAM